MPLNLYRNIYASGSIPAGWKPLRESPEKVTIHNPRLLAYLQGLLPGRWKKVYKRGTGGVVHYCEHESGQVADVKFNED